MLTGFQWFKILLALPVVVNFDLKKILPAGNDLWQVSCRVQIYLGRTL